ncbi:CinA family protein [Agromyces bracchium]|uniref:Nicotinamide-nucleotide amidohydrolase family protein n=1 Tax=Agromyces bracchium TaxID=88376 RepID=A0A6I3M465_9MICO|nr:nicotinamide-nucleotide amidohydrolase family protein [Agromyces bracchium]MTH67671.1 nicotinamide-nucleotide amidohydrolase family protein [Agromyces bracchium]
MPPAADATADPAAELIAELTRRGLRIAVAESLTGGLVTAELTRIPGASVVVNGGIVAYDTSVKRSLLGVPADLLAAVGAVHPEVARRMADGVRSALAVDDRPADLGLATTGVAGPDPQDGKAVGTVYIGVATADGADAIALQLAGAGGRDAIRAATVRAAIDAALARVRERN